MCNPCGIGLLPQTTGCLFLNGIRPLFGSGLPIRTQTRANYAIGLKFANKSSATCSGPNRIHEPPRSPGLRRPTRCCRYRGMVRSATAGIRQAFHKGFRRSVPTLYTFLSPPITLRSWLSCMCCDTLKSGNAESSQQDSSESKNRLEQHERVSAFVKTDLQLTHH